MESLATACCTSFLLNDGPTAHWLGPEILLGLKIEGCGVNALADNGIQVNTVTSGYVHQHKFPVLPLEDLVDYPPKLNMVGRYRDKASWICGLVSPGQ